MSAPRVALVLVTLLALAGCGGGSEDGAAPTAGVEQLGNVLALRSDFEADAGKTRVIMLLSPT